MNILEFATKTMISPDQYQLRTASSRIVEVTYISESDPYPIRGVIKDHAPGVDFVCQWDKNGYPHNLPLTHGLTLLPYRAKTIYERIPSDQLESIDLR